MRCSAEGTDKHAPHQDAPLQHQPPQHSRTPVPQYEQAPNHSPHQHPSTITPTLLKYTRTRVLKASLVSSHWHATTRAYARNAATATHFVLAMYFRGAIHLISTLLLRFCHYIIQHRRYFASILNNIHSQSPAPISHINCLPSSPVQYLPT